MGPTFWGGSKNDANLYYGNFQGFNLSDLIIV